jgi:hypothetical protein
MDVQFHLFFAKALATVSGQLHSVAVLPQVKDPQKPGNRDCVGPSASLDAFAKRKSLENFSESKSDSSVVQPTA